MESHESEDFLIRLSRKEKTMFWKDNNGFHHILEEFEGRKTTQTLCGLGEHIKRGNPWIVENIPEGSPQCQTCVKQHAMAEAEKSCVNQ